MRLGGKQAASEGCCTLFLVRRWRAKSRMPCSYSGLGIGHARGSRTPPPLARNEFEKLAWIKKKNLDFYASSAKTLRVSRKQANNDLETIVVYSSYLDLSFERLVSLKRQRGRIRARNFDERVMPKWVIQIWNVQKCLNFYFSWDFSALLTWTRRFLTLWRSSASM